MKFLKVFSLFILLHVAAWGGTHMYLSQNQPDILVVVDTSFAMKPHFPDMKQWIVDYESKSRYKNIIIGTDKAQLGQLSLLKSKATIFRASFGRMKPENLNRYLGVKAKKKILLTDKAFAAPDGWQVVRFE